MNIRITSWTVPLARIGENISSLASAVNEPTIPTHRPEATLASYDLVLMKVATNEAGVKEFSFMVVVLLLAFPNGS
jgi:hypothetical protein